MRCKGLDNLNIGKKKGKDKGGNEKKEQNHLRQNVRNVH